MSRLVAALAALILAAPALGAQEEKTGGEVDPKTQAAIQREVEKAKEDIRNEVRAEIQGAQSAAEFLGAVAEGPKLEFLQIDGYLRVRGQMMVNLDVSDTPDASGFFLFPVPLRSTSSDTINTANMRFRLEPTLNVSEHVRVRAQIDVLDNHVLGSSTSALQDDPGSPFPVPFYGTSRVVTAGDPRLDRPAISPKRAWAEIQTPVGLLGFGRMPSEWGLGILTNAGSGIDDDLGDTVDRIQFAIPPVTTPIGRLTFVPMIDWDAEGVLQRDPRAGNTGVGQPFDAESADDARTYALKVARLDTDDEVRRKLDRRRASVNYGAYYGYRAQRFFYPAFGTDGLDCTTAPPEGTPGCADAATAIHRSAYAHIADLWFRWLSPRLRVETEVAGVWGHIANASDDPAQPSGEILLRQWGAALVTEYQLTPNRLMLGVDAGAASGDDAPGFGNVPFRRQAGAAPGALAPYGSVEGPQWGGADRTIRNFRFNPAYRVDLILWRHVLGQVTDAFYVKPKLRWNALPGLRIDFSLVYSRALNSESTPSASADASGNLVDAGTASLGVEADTIVTYTSAGGLEAWGQWGVLQPMDGLSFNDAGLSRAHFLAFGIAAKF